VSQDPSEIIQIRRFAAQEIFVKLKTVVLLNIFVETDSFFGGSFDE